MTSTSADTKPYRSHPGIAALAAVAALFALSSATPVAADSFKRLKGSWSGNGSASFTNGQREQLRCSARYTGAGKRLGIRLRCASASASINLSGRLDRVGRRVSGNWSEASFGYGGSAFGSSNANGVRLRIRGDLNGSLGLSVSGRTHTLALSSKGTTLTGVRVRMRRR